MISMKFAAFVMTFERPSILQNTISELFSQTFPPEKILIVDNSVSTDSQNLVTALNDIRVEYYRVGKNVGPAGASEIGLQKLANEGYDWIYWGDDDDPPKFNNVLEKLLLLANSIENIGVIGAVGHNFNKHKGLVVRTKDEELDKVGYLEVDIIAGNMSMIVNAAVIKKGILPNPDFFLNIEEYDFCLRVKQHGFKVVVGREVFKNYRASMGRLGLAERAKRVLPKESVLWRKYYSTRNLIYMLNNDEKSRIGALNVSYRALIKSMIGFKNGFGYGLLNAKMELKGISDGWNEKMGIGVLPNKKY